MKLLLILFSILAGPFTADVGAGATFTSNAVIEAVNSLFTK